MGLDQYAYVALKAGESAEYWDDDNYDKNDGDPTKLSKPREIACWRKHPNLHGWMERLWQERNPDIKQDPKYDSVFNGIELELTWDDLDRLEVDILEESLPDTRGFFFGNNSDDHYLSYDLEFVRCARAEIFCGFKVFYNSSW